MKNYKYYKTGAKTKLHTALIMLEQYTFKEGLEWTKSGVDIIKGNTRIDRLKKCEDIVRKYITEKWG